MNSEQVKGALDVAAERARTLGCRSAHHLNAAGAALPTETVVDEVVAHLRLEQKHGGYEAAALVAERIEGLYGSAARLIGARPAEIALFDSASTGLRAIVDALRLGPPTRLIVSRSTYVSHALHLLTLGRERCVEIVIVPSAADGALDLDALDRLLASGGPAVVCVAHIPTSSGLVEPVMEIGAITRGHGARYLLDATQSVGQVTVDVEAIRCDALVTTGRKFLRAPRGTGFAYVRADLLEQLEPTAPDVRGAVWTADRAWSLAGSARRFETWEASVAGRAGLAVAIDEAIARGVETTERHLVRTAANLRAELSGIGRVTVQDPAASPSGIVTFTVDGMASSEVSALLAARKVRTVSVPASHAQWDLGGRDVEAVVRASLHVYNDAADTAALVAGVEEIAGGAA